MNLQLWWKADKGKAYERVFEYVRRVEAEQSDTFDRFAKLEGLYDPYSPAAGDTDGQAQLANVTENVVASNVDTVYAAVATTEVRARILTDNADWSTQRRSRHLEWYIEAQGKEHQVHQKCRRAFKESAKKGNGMVKVTKNGWDEICVRQVPIEEIVVPESDTRDDSPPRQLHHVMRNYDREQLLAEYPEHAQTIEAAHGTRGMGGYRPLTEDKVVVIESWRLPIGKKPAKGKKTKAKYVPGRHTITIEGADLLDEEYHRPYFPLSMITWSSRTGSFYGISGAERIAGIQRALNKRNWQIERALDQNALLTTYVRPADANLAVKTSKVGNIAVVRGDYPHTPNPPIVAGETYQSRIQLKDAAFEEFGVSRLAAQSHKPAGLDSGIALREYRDQTTVRFAPQEKDFEQLVLDTYCLILDVCKDLGAAAPDAIRMSKYGPQKIEWSRVDMGDVRVQMTAASTLPRTSAGRQQTLLEWAQAGLITTDEVRKLSQHPDLERVISSYTAALEAIEWQIEQILEGEMVVPEPFDHLALCESKAKAEYLNARSILKVPEEILEALRQFASQAAYMLGESQKPPANANAAMPLDPMAQPAMGGPPQAALASQAMDLMAG